MGFFKDFKDDFSQALNELLPGDDFTEADDIQVNTMDNELDIEQELSKLDGLLEQVEKKSNQTVATEVSPEPELRPLDEVEVNTLDESVEEEAFVDYEPDVLEEPEDLAEFEVVEEPEATEEPEAAEESGATEEPEVAEEPEAAKEPEVEVEAEALANIQAEKDDAGEQIEAQISEELYNTYMKDTMKEEKTMDMMDTTVTSTTQTTEASVEAEINAAVDSEVTDEVSVITAGTSIKGNMETTGSFEIEGKIEGDIKCNGKLTVIGSIIGNSTSSEFFADAAHIEGEVVSSGTVKVGLGSVMIGKITDTSAVIAGAVKGDIDVQGPVVVDTSAVIMGNIKSRSVQINNGAVIEGFFSQCYSDVDVESLFSQSK